MYRIDNLIIKIDPSKITKKGIISTLEASGVEVTSYQKGDRISTRTIEGKTYTCTEKESDNEN